MVPWMLKILNETIDANKESIFKSKESIHTMSVQ